MGFGFFGAEEDGLGLFGADHEVDVVGRPEAVGKGGEEGICVGREVDAAGGRFEVEDGADEGGVLVGEAVVLLTGPGAGFDVVDRGDVFAPGGFTGLPVVLVMVTALGSGMEVVTILLNLLY